MGLLLTFLHSLGHEWQHYINVQERISDSLRYSVSVSQSVSGRGRPRFTVLKDQLEYLRSLSFTWTEIASLLGVSRMTLYRRRQEFGLLDDPIRAISDIELRRKVSLSTIVLNSGDWSEIIWLLKFRTLKSTLQ